MPRKMIREDRGGETHLGNKKECGEMEKWVKGWGIYREQRGGNNNQEYSRVYKERIKQ